MKKLLIIFLSLLSLSAFADDTATLNAALATSNVTLTSGHTYNISGTLQVKHALNFNGATIITTQAVGAALAIQPGGSVSGPGKLSGVYNIASPGGSGAYGIAINRNDCPISGIHITKFPAHGIACGAYNNPIITYCTIDSVGYWGFFYLPEANTTGGTFSHNIIDRSMIAPPIYQADMGIKGSSSGPYITKHWTITDNTFYMRSNPADPNNEGFEVRNLDSSTIARNTVIGGSIGISVVNCTHMTVYSNTCTGQNKEGIEYAVSNHCLDSLNKIPSSLNDGYLIDGASPYCNNLRFVKDSVTNVIGSPFHVYTGANKLFYIVSCYFSTPKYGLDLQKTDSVFVTDTHIDGGGNSGSAGVLLDQGPGHIFFTRGSVTNCTYIIQAYNTTLNQVVDNIIGHNVNLSGTPTIKYGVFSNGAMFGTNIHFITTSMTFGPITAKTYGAANFDPGATSSLPITYTSSNTGISTIVSGNAHIVNSGTVNIIASNGDTSITQSLVINKAPLSISANNLSKYKGMINPALTASYYGFVLGENQSALTTGPSLSTTAMTGSPVGVYPITVSGATASNYNITFTNGILTIIPRPSFYGFVLHKKVVVKL